MYLMYADESGNTGTDYDNKEQPIFVLGSFIIDDNNWHDINNYFQKKKVEIYNKLEYYEIHTNEIFSPKRNSVFRNPNWKENYEILNKLVDTILELPLKFSFVAIDKKSFKHNIYKQFDSMLKIDPYIYAFCRSYNYFSNTLKSKKSKGMIFLDEIISIPEYLNKIYPELSINNNFIIEQALFLKSKDSNFIQIADVYAFYICQALNIKKEYKKYSDYKSCHCLNNYNKLLKKTDFDSTEFLT